MRNKFLQFFAVLFLMATGSAQSQENSMKKPTEGAQMAVFAMGCFWCGAAAFADHDSNVHFPGILSVRSGYAGGTIPNPVYEHHPGYVESVQVTYDPKIISYEKLLEIFWHSVDPFDERGQFCDKGDPYKAVIFYSPAQEKEARASLQEIEKKLGKKTEVALTAYTNFWDAEEYHQDYKIKNPVRYKLYRWNCGRDARLKEVWGIWHYVP